ncbi:glycosyltransferase [Luteimonas sp. MC1750]|uniref:glycosyltransferase n=1 Tax=Luteimonas sp. MC1750 TaxID=2799326 RepID=UPI0018F09E75|nr:glycosyltransferase [Luteimonas sp. MC1750]MBJ6984071.1 glycosyltransferase [Luteimonas sp. MC1750]QQO06881.1 glycosyltransferase [Luteimonas sp. MC1750]
MTRRVHSILHVVDSLETGGLERVVVDLAIAQRDHGHRVAVFSLTDTAGLGPELEAAGIPVMAGGKRAGLDLGLLSRLRGAMDAHGADIVHSHNFVPSYQAALALAPRLRARAALVNTCHNMGGRLARPRLRLLYRLSLTRTARVAGVGRQVAEHLVASGLAPAARVSAVRNGVPLPPASTSATRSRARAALGLPADALVVACVGRLVALKNHRLLLGQVPELATTFPRLHVVLLGDGPERAALERQAQALGIAERVLFAGTRRDVPKLLPGVDVFALPSLTEGLSIALLEACAAGLPVVASDVGGNPEIVRHGRTGLLVPVDDGDALRAALLRILGDRPLRLALGLAAREWVMTHASIDAMRLSYDRLYADALAGARHDVTPGPVRTA